MVDYDFTITFLVVSDLYERYTIVVNSSTRSTSVYCEECEEWVVRWEGEKLSQHSSEELLGMIVDEHEVQVLGEEVGFQPKPLSIGDDK